MQVIDRIKAIEARAEAINLTLSRLCREAGVHLSTIERWRGGSDIRVRNATRICEALEGRLAEHERAVARRLEDAGVLRRAS